MSYTNGLDKPTNHFDVTIYTGNGASTPSGSGSTQTISSLNFAPDWVWIKDRSQSGHNHNLADTLRGAPNLVFSDEANTETTDTTDGFTSFTSNGFTLGDNGEGTQSLELNKSGNTYVAWSWLAGGTAPAITYTVKVVSDSGNKYRFDDFGTSAVTLDLQEGGTYTFDQSDSSNSGHPLRFYTAADKSGGEYTTGVTTTGTAGNSGAKTVITVAASAPTLYYQCSNHAGMGGQANTNSLHGSSNFQGDLQAIVSANTTAGFSLVKATSDNSSNRFIGHGLNQVPDVIWAKNLDSAYNWDIYFKVLGYNDSYRLNTTNAGRTGAWGSSSFTTTKFETGNSYSSANGEEYIYYCFAEKKGFSKFGEFTSINDDSGVFVPCGFAPRWVLLKPQVSDGWSNWYIFDTTRDHPQLNENPLFANLSTRENYYGGSPASNYDQIDIVSNGFKIRRDSNWGVGGNGQKSIFMAFAEFPFVTSTGIPTTAL